MMHATSLVCGNMFSALRAEDKRETVSERERSDSESSSKDRPAQSPSPSRATTIAAVVAEPAAALASGKVLSTEECERKTANMVEEYFSVADKKEAVACVQELNNPEYHKEVIVTVVNYAMEHKEVDRERAADLFSALFDAGVLNSEQYIQGLSMILEFIEDVAIDIPQVYQFVGAFIGRAVADGHLEFAPVVPELAHLRHSNKALVVIASALKTIKASKGEKAAKAAWTTSGVDVAEQVAEDRKGDLKQALADQGIAFLLEEGSAEPAAVDLEKELFEKLNKNGTNATVLEWIKAHVPASDQTSAEFVRTLTAAVLGDVTSRCVGKADDANIIKTLFEQRASLLKAVVEDQPDRELQVLLAVQAAGHKNRTSKNAFPFFVERWFAALYEHEVITSDSFENWRDDTKHPEGKETAIAETVKFFDFIKEP
eukprot:Opistho-2@32173